MQPESKSTTLLFSVTLLDQYLRAAPLVLPVDRELQHPTSPFEPGLSFGGWM